jgi:hypothetical protein
MRNFNLHALLTLIAATTASAEFSAPLGKGLESLDFSYVDSFVVSGGYQASYAEESLSGEAAKELFAANLPEGGYTLDTARRIVTYLPQGWMVTTDSAGLQSESKSSVLVGDVATIQMKKRVYDEQRRPIGELDATITKNLNGAVSPIAYDSMLWVWTHSGCADDFAKDTLRIWSVDAQGRCDTARLAVHLQSDPVYLDLVDKIVWQGDHPSMALRLQGADTLLRDAYTFDLRGRVVQSDSYGKDRGRWVLQESHSYAYVEDRLDRISLVAYDTGGLQQRLDFQSTRSRTGVSPVSRPGTRWMATRQEGDVVSFTNRSSESAAIDLFDAHGRRLDALVVPAGSTVRRAALKGQVFWRARTSFGDVSGMLPVVR